MVGWVGFLAGMEQKVAGESQSAIGVKVNVIVKEGLLVVERVRK